MRSTTALRKSSIFQEQYLSCNNNSPHQLMGIYPLGTTCASKGSATAVYSASYDPWGNETSRTYNSITSTLSYDTLNRMTEYNAGANSQEFYLYDGSGNRVLKRSISGGSTKLTVYAFGLQELSYTGSGAYSSQTDYYSIAGHLLGSTNGTATTYDLTDAEGSVLTSLSSSAVLGEQIYGPYGNQRYTQGTMGTDKGYTGQFQDAVSGFDYYNARYYDPVMGQFLSADHMQGNAQGMDPYSYVNGNPETATDPTGNFGIGFADKIGATLERSGSVGAALERHLSGTGDELTRHISSGKTTKAAKGTAGKSATGGSPDSYKDKAQQDAYYMSQVIKRTRSIDGDKSKHNYAMGEWFITDDDGNPLSWFSGFDPGEPIGQMQVSDRYAGNLDTHDRDAEQKILRNWNYEEELVEMKLLWLLGYSAVLHVVLFSQYSVCEKCDGFLDSYGKGMSSAMTTLTNIFPRASKTLYSQWLSIDVFTSIDTTYSRVFSPGTVNSPGDLHDDYHGAGYVLPMPE